MVVAVVVGGEVVVGGGVMVGGGVTVGGAGVRWCVRWCEVDVAWVRAATWQQLPCHW